MDTIFEVDPNQISGYLRKNGEFNFYICDNSENKVIGCCKVNWADFVKVGKHTKQIFLSDKLMYPYFKSSFLKIDIET